MNPDHKKYIIENILRGSMRKILTIVITLAALLFSASTQAQESEGLIQKTYKKFITKDKVAEKKPASSLEVASTNQEAVREGVKTGPAGNYYKNLSKAGLIQEIKDEVGSEERILPQIPELKRQKGEDEKYIYSYLVEGKQVNLEDVDENVLRTLMAQVSEVVEKFRTDAVMAQQEQLGMMRSIGATLHPPQAPPMPLTVPQNPPVPRRKQKAT